MRPILRGSQAEIGPMHSQISEIPSMSIIIRVSIEISITLLSYYGPVGHDSGIYLAGLTKIELVSLLRIYLRYMAIGHIRAPISFPAFTPFGMVGSRTKYAR